MDEKDGQEPSAISRRVKFLVAGIFIAGILIFVASALFLNNEPRAFGHPLSTWLKGDEKAGLHMDQAEAAINEIGEPAIPILLSKLQAKDPPWKDSLYRLCSRIPRSPIRFTWARDEQQQGVYGFSCLGPKARPAIPQLTKLLYESNSANAAGLALACIGDESLS